MGRRTNHRNRSSGNSWQIALRGLALRVNLLPNPKALDLWLTFAGPTVMADQGAAPDGTTTADLVTFTAAANGEVYQSLGAGVAPAGSYEFGLWARTTSGTKEFRFRYATGGVGTLSAGMIATTTWQRFVFTFTSVGEIAAAGIVNDAVGVAGSALFWNGELLAA